VRGAGGPSLYDDVLCVVFGFLPFRARAHVASVAKQWNRVTTTGTVKGVCSVNIYRWSDIGQFGRSAVARNHLTQFNFDYELKWPRNQELSNFLAPLPSFRRLRCIHIWLKKTPPMSLALTLRRCSTLRVMFADSFTRQNTAFMRSFLVPRFPMIHLQKISCIELNPAFCRRIAASAPNLTDLNISASGTRGMEQCIPLLLPRLRHLKTLVIQCTRNEVIRATLFADMDCESMKQIIFVNSNIHESMVPWFAALPKLNSLKFCLCIVPDFSTFAHAELTTFIASSSTPERLPKRVRNPKLRKGDFL
jgi:hypothetical protein